MADDHPADWRARSLRDPGLLQDLAVLPLTSLSSLLLPVMERRAQARDLPALLRQWERDDFTGPAPVDQRTLLRIDDRLLTAAAAFEAVELSPLAPLGTCSRMGLTSQNKIVSALRGLEVLSDPTNALALESALRLRAAPEAVVRLATCQRVVRAQRLPPRDQRRGIARHFDQHFRLFALSSAGREVRDHGLLVDALVEHIDVHLRAYNLLERDGYSLAGRTLRLLATAERAPLMERVAAACAGRADITRDTLAHGYYSGGLRFQISVRVGADEVPLSDGGAFDWLARLGANRRHVFVASGLGSQLIAAACSL